MGSEASSVGWGIARGTTRSEESPTGTGAQFEGDTVPRAAFVQSPGVEGTPQNGEWGQSQELTQYLSVLEVPIVLLVRETRHLLLQQHKSYSLGTQDLPFLLPSSPTLARTEISQTLQN